MILSSRVLNIAASQSLQMAARAKQMRAAGIDVISMSLGEPDMPTPEPVRRAAKQAVDDHWSHYGPVPGIPSLREAIAMRQNRPNPNPSLKGRENNITITSPFREETEVGSSILFTADDVIVSVGAKMAIYNAIQSLVGPGDEVIIPQPAWVSYSEMVRLAEGMVVPVRTRFEDRYCLTPDRLRAAITPRTRLLILCSPNNPTGSVYSAAELAALVEVLADYPDIAILSDEIYNCISYENIGDESAAPGWQRPGMDTSPSLSAFPELAERLVIVNGVSKAFAMTGYRIGWLLSKNRAFIEACTRLQSQQLTCATMVAQRAAEAALTQDPASLIRPLVATFAERRELICRLAAEIPGFRFVRPQGAFYLFPDVSELFRTPNPKSEIINHQFEIINPKSDLSSADALAEYLLSEAHVAVVSGSAFGEPNCIRLSYAISTEEIIEAMRRIKAAVERL